MKASPRRKGLPKFDSTGWLSIGILFSLALFGNSMWAAIEHKDLQFFPFRFGEILGVIIGLGLAIHCVDMIFYHKKNKR